MVFAAILQICPAAIFLAFPDKDNSKGCCKDYTSQNQNGYPPLACRLLFLLFRVICLLKLDDRTVYNRFKSRFLLKFFTIFILVYQSNRADRTAVLAAILVPLAGIQGNNV